MQEIIEEIVLDEPNQSSISTVVQQKQNNIEDYLNYLKIHKKFKIWKNYK